MDITYLASITVSIYNFLVMYITLIENHKVRITLTLLIILASSIVFSTMAYRGYAYDQGSIFYGQTYLLNNKWMHTIDFDYYKVCNSCTRSENYGFGIGFDILNLSHTSWRVKYFRTFSPSNFAPYIAISPSRFRCERGKGWNLKPEVGFRFGQGHWPNVSPTISISYGYQFPLKNETYYFADRHELSLKLALTINKYKPQPRRRRGCGRTRF